MTVETQAQGPTPSSGWLAKLGTLSILYLAVFLTRIGFGVILVIFPLYLPIPKTQSAFAGAVTAIYPVVEGVSALPVGAYVDRKGRRKVFVAGLGTLANPNPLIWSSTKPFPGGGAPRASRVGPAMWNISVPARRSHPSA